MEIALAPLTLHRPHPLEVITTAAEAGYDLTGIQLGLYGQPLSPLANDPDFLAAAAKALKSGGIGVLEVSNIVLDEHFQKGDATALVSFAAAVGARLVQVVGWDPEPERAAAHLAFAADFATDVGLDLAVEFMPYSRTRTLGDARALIAAAGRPNVKVFLDSLHLFRSGGSVAEVAALVAADPGSIVVIQLSDAPRSAPAPEQLRPESVGDRLVPGEGELALCELLAVLPAGLPVSVEVPNRALEDRALLEQARVVLAGTRRFLEQAVLST